MTKILLSYRVTLAEPLASHRRQIWFKTEQQANNRIKKLIKINKQNELLKYSEFRMTEAKVSH